MKFVTNVIGTALVYATFGAAIVIGYNAGEKLWEDKLEPMMDKKLHK